MRVIGLEEHFVLPEVLSAWKEAPDEDGDVVGVGDGPLARALCDVGEGRLAAMDDQGLDVQVLSLNSPGVQNLGAADAVSVARDANDALAELVAAHPDRFQGFAAVPTPDPAAAAAEFERSVRDLRFRGAMLNGRTGTRTMDDPAFDDLYGVAARLGAPLHLHPQVPVAPVIRSYYSGFSDEIDQAFSQYGVGWHYETGVQFLRMVVGGVFDRHPELQVILGHWGEVVLFFTERIAQSMEGVLHLQRPLEEVLRHNVWVAGSGLLSERYLRWAAEVVGPDRLLYSTDYPFMDTSGGRARTFAETAPLTEEQRVSAASEAWERLTGHLAG